MCQVSGQYELPPPLTPLLFCCYSMAGMKAYSFHFSLCYKFVSFLLAQGAPWRAEVLC